MDGVLRELGVRVRKPTRGNEKQIVHSIGSAVAAATTQTQPQPHTQKIKNVLRSTKYRTHIDREYRRHSTVLTSILRSRTNAKNCSRGTSLRPSPLPPPPPPPFSPSRPFLGNQAFSRRLWPVRRGPSPLPSLSPAVLLPPPLSDGANRCVREF